MTTQRVSVFNCVSNALDMLKLSSESILDNAGTDNFDYIVVCWNASQDVISYLNELGSKYKNLILAFHNTNNSVGFVPNLRAMMNVGFDLGFRLNEYCGLVNTDMYFGKDWLINLVKHATPGTIVNSVHITRIGGPHVITEDLGVPTRSSFNFKRFDEIYNNVFNDVLEHEDTRGGWLATNTMPYLIPRAYWEVAGPWELNHTPGQETPDRRFFQRCHNAGAKFTMSKSSIVYHHEAVERRTSRPAGAECMSET